MTTHRIEALSDGVFAIAMTLLIIEVHVPHVDTTDASALVQALRQLAPQIGAFVVSFLILGTLWIGYHTTSPTFGKWIAHCCGSTLAIYVQLPSFLSPRHLWPHTGASRSAERCTESICSWQACSYGCTGSMPRVAAGSLRPISVMERFALLASESRWAWPSIWQRPFSRSSGPPPILSSSQRCPSPI